MTRNWKRIQEDPSAPEADRFEAALMMLLEDHDKVEIDLEKLNVSIAVLDDVLGRITRAGYHVVGFGTTRTIVRV
jgi:CRISPR/Cas system CSM-associated protein Csm3 (group 7 of RAMP superfamily)